MARLKINLMYIWASLVVWQIRKVVFIKRGRGNHAVTKAMYFTQEKNPNLRVCTLSWHWLHCLCIRLHTGGLSDITNWWYYFTYFFYVPNFLPKQWKLLLWDWVEWKFILLWVPYAVYCSFGWKNSSEFSGCYHESVFKPSYSSADLSVTHQNRPIMHQGAR